MEYARPLWLHWKTKQIIIGIEESEGMQVNYIRNMFNKVIVE
jgi:hypothetical protein